MQLDTSSSQFKRTEFWFSSGISQNLSNFSTIFYRKMKLVHLFNVNTATKVTHLIGFSQNLNFKKISLAQVAAPGNH